MTTLQQWAVLAAVVPMLLAGTLVPVHGQVNPGARIRVVTDSGSSHSRLGTLVSLDADSLQFRAAKDSVIVSVATGSLVRLEQSKGRRSNAGRGAFIGALVGAGTGLILGVLASTEKDAFYDVNGEDILAASAILGATGAGIGALLGATGHRERWERVPPPGRSSGAHRATDRVELSIAF